MGGLSRFLLGGVLGAIFGFLVSSTRTKKVRKAPPRKPAEPVAAPPVSEVAEPVAEAAELAVEVAEPVAEAAELAAEVAEPVAEPIEVAEPAVEAAAPVAELAEPLTEAAELIEVAEPIVLEPVAEPVAEEQAAPLPEPAGGIAPEAALTPEPVAPQEAVPLPEPTVEPEPTWEFAETAAAEETIPVAMPVSEPPAELRAEVTPEIESPAVAEAVRDVAIPAAPEVSEAGLAAIPESVATEEAPIVEPPAEPSAWTWEEEPRVEWPAPTAQTPAEVSALEQVEAPAAEPVSEEASEVVLTPEVLEEPVPGMGWIPSMEPSTEETFEEEFPVIPEEPLPYVAPEAELPETLAEAAAVEPWEEEEPAPPVQYFRPAYTEEAEAPMEIVPSAVTPSEETFAPPPSAAPTSVDDLKARIEETRRRIRRELEQPFLSLGDQGPATAQAESHPEADDFAPLESGEESHAPEVMADSLPDLMNEPEAGYQIVELDVGSGQDAAVPGETAAEGPSTTAVAPTAEEQAPIEQLSKEQPASGGPVPAPSAPTSSVAMGEQGASMELGIDYDAMRSRIEETRSRLKSKAFDAMMTGESSLLSKDSPEPGPAQTSGLAVDQETDETIEASLREEDH